MNYSKETLWHFTCKFCKLWWSFAASDDWHPERWVAAHPSKPKSFYCPHCGKDQIKDEDIEYTGIM